MCAHCHVQLFVTLWAVVHQAPLSIGFCRQEHWSGLPFPPRGYLPNPGIQPMFPVSAALAGGFFTTEPPGKSHTDCTEVLKKVLNIICLFLVTQWCRTLCCLWLFYHRMDFSLLGSSVHGIFLGKMTGVGCHHYSLRKHVLKPHWRTSLTTQWLRLWLPVQGMRVWSLIRELRSHMSCSQK